MGSRGNGIFIKLLSKVLRKVEKFRERYPIEKAKKHAAFFLIFFMAVPLSLLTLLVHLPIIVWDLIDPWSIDVPDLIHLCFCFLYIGSGAFVAMEIKEVWDTLEIVYHPLDAIKDNTVESLIKPLRNGLIKIDIIIGVVILAVVTTDSVSIYLTGFTGFHLAVFLVIFIIGALMLGISGLIYFVIKGLLILLIDVLFRKMDRTFHISDKLGDFYNKVRSEDITIDIEVE